MDAAPADTCPACRRPRGVCGPECPRRLAREAMARERGDISKRTAGSEGIARPEAP